MKINRLTTRPHCPRCDTLLDATVDFTNDGQPRPDDKPGDTTVCGYCGLVLAFTDEMGLRRATAREIAVVQGQPELWRQAMRRQARWLAGRN